MLPEMLMGMPNRTGETSSRCGQVPMMSLSPPSKMVTVQFQETFAASCERGACSSQSSNCAKFERFTDGCIAHESLQGVRPANALCNPPSGMACRGAKAATAEILTVTAGRCAARAACAALPDTSSTVQSGSSKRAA